MPYAEHDVFTSPEPQARLWRYVDFTKYVSLLNLRALWFSRADLLGDRFEGSVSSPNVEHRAQIYHNAIPAETLAQHANVRRALPHSMYINCWHMSEYESAAVWKLYVRDQGVAIQTTFDALTNSLTTKETVYAGVVKYIDFRTTFMPEGNLFWPFVHKRQSFDFEHEVRAVVARDLPIDQITSSEDSFEPGIAIRADLGMLLQRVYVAPDAPAWFAELVRVVTARFDVSVDVNQSDLAGDPVY